MWNYNPSELYHFGVKGMRWGVRRYQNADGSLTAAGRKRYGSESNFGAKERRQARKEVRADNRRAFELGKKATVLGEASKLANDAASRREHKIEKLRDAGYDQNGAKVPKQASKLAVDYATKNRLNAEYEKARHEVESFSKELISKYGDQAVTSIRRRDGVISENVNRGRDWLAAAAVSAAITTMTPMVAIFTPSDKRTLGRSAYQSERQVQEMLYNAAKRK